MNEHELVIAGITTVLKSFASRARVVELNVRAPARGQVDVLLYDPLFFSAVRKTDPHALPGRGRLAALGWEVEPGRVRALVHVGVSGYIYKGLGAEDLVDAITRVHHGEHVVPEVPVDRGDPAAYERWPGDHVGLSDRESQIIVMICRGSSNSEIASSVFVSVNTVKTYIRSAYRKIGTTSRTQTIVWGLSHDFGDRQDREPATAATSRGRAVDTRRGGPVAVLATPRAAVRTREPGRPRACSSCAPPPGATEGPDRG